MLCLPCYIPVNRKVCKGKLDPKICHRGTWCMRNWHMLTQGRSIFFMLIIIAEAQTLDFMECDMCVRWFQGISSRASVESRVFFMGNWITHVAEKTQICCTCPMLLSKSELGRDYILTRYFMCIIRKMDVPFYTYCTQKFVKSYVPVMSQPTAFKGL